MLPRNRLGDPSGCVRRVFWSRHALHPEPFRVGVGGQGGVGNEALVETTHEVETTAGADELDGPRRAGPGSQHMPGGDEQLGSFGPLVATDADDRPVGGPRRRVIRHFGERRGMQQRGAARRYRPVLGQPGAALARARQPVLDVPHEGPIDGLHLLARDVVQPGRHLTHSAVAIGEVVEDAGLMVEERKDPRMVGQEGGRLRAEDQVVSAEIETPDVLDQRGVGEEAGILPPHVGCGAVVEDCSRPQQRREGLFLDLVTVVDEETDDAFEQALEAAHHAVVGLHHRDLQPPLGHWCSSSDRASNSSRRS